jgi:hypothetical protein
MGYIGLVKGDDKTCGVDARRKTMKVFKQISLMWLALAFLCTPDASALTVVTSFIGGVPPANAAGGGNLTDIVNAAARIWESAYLDPVTITLNFGWAPTGDAGTHTLMEQGGTPNRETTGLILFDNSGAAKFYLDPTPNINEEFRRRTEEYQDLGGGNINVARLFANPVGDAAGHTDLLSVVVHEMGHALGMCAANSAFRQEATLGAIRLAEDLPFAGTVIPLAANNAGITSHFDAIRVTYGAVMAGISGDERRLPSALDILANAEISGFRMLNLEREKTPPSRLSPARAVGRPGTSALVRRSSR